LEIEQPSLTKIACRDGDSVASAIGEAEYLDCGNLHR
jgi:hypothetical protein